MKAAKHNNAYLEAHFKSCAKRLQPRRSNTRMVAQEWDRPTGGLETSATKVAGDTLATSHRTMCCAALPLPIV